MTELTGILKGFCANCGYDIVQGEGYFQRRIMGWDVVELIHEYHYERQDED